MDQLFLSPPRELTAVFSQLKIALEYLQEFIYYAYTFYTALLERETFLDYRPGWLEALGDLARYRIVIAAMVPTQIRPSRTLTAAAVRSRLGASSDGSSMSIFLVR
jgi:protein SMG6